MTSDLAKLMEKISLLQSEELPEPIIEIEKPTMHPLLQAMQELKEEGVVEYINKDTVKPDFTVEKEIQNGYILKAQGLENGEGIEIKVFDPKNVFSNVPIADATFKLNNDDKTLTSSLTTVHHKYQKQGIARAMYQFVHDLGNDIQASKTLLPGGQQMWDAFGSTFNNEPEEPEVKKSLWQRLFKEADAIDEEIAYHGTVDDIAEFHPLSHFGTEKAAKDRMTYKKIKDGKIYKVDLNIKNPLTIKDFPGVHYDRLYAFELRDKKLISQKEMEAITTIDDKVELRKALLTKLNELGIDGFVYKNKYEDKGNLSYVIVDPSQVKVLSVEPATEEVTEASPDTLEGSFTPDLVESKTWLAEMLAKGLKGKNAGTIYVLGSWYGNMGIFLQQAGVQFDKLVLVEPDEEALMRSKDLLQQIGDEGKLILIHQKAEDVVYEKPGVVINTSCNETGPVFLTKLPDNMLCLLQARNNNENTLFPTEDEEDFIDYFPLETVYYTGKKHLEDPEVNYVRYMKIGRTGKKIDETISTGQGGGSAGVGEFIIENFGKYPEIEFICVNKDVPGSTDPKDQEALFQSLKKVPGIVVYRQDFDEDEDDFSGGKSLAVIIVKGGNTTAKRVKALAAQHNVKIDLTAQKDDRFIDRLYNGSEPAVTDWFDNSIDKEMYETISTGQGGGSAGKGGGQMVGGPTTYEQEYDMFKSKGPRRITAMTNEALDSSYPFDVDGRIKGRYRFKTEKGLLYVVYFQGDDLVEVSFSAVMPGDDTEFREKTSMTGTGDSRKVLGTVVEIVRDYLDKYSPDSLYFTADNDEPSRVKLYNTMISQVDKALPNYYASKPTDLGVGVAYWLKRKEDEVTNEALDSSYEYHDSKQNPGNDFYFDTEDGQEYKVEIDNVDNDITVAFSARGQGDEHKTGITGTGNSRKIFGTVIKIVKDYIRKSNPEIIAFSANNSEPSRVRLYKMLASQANKELPNYNFTDAFSNGGLTTYYLTRDGAKIPTSTKVKAKAGKALDAVFEEES